MNAVNTWHSLRDTTPPADALVMVAASSPDGWAFNLVRYDSETSCWLDHSAGTEDEIDGIDGYEFWQTVAPPVARPRLSLLQGGHAR
ncbi:hypothetical protein HW932_19145 [Allochromatium humboldtianum]|uniref:Uncharacterized protein n=1 Tax=Allochromatium humboldtianum TaxID=504901 RepID=A0A850RKG5_9GAMM|nr:hypothetical protein [Allochromatium humboldtianum]NVZ11370.1 hypothetical protein [Allochromatium humboldtianum]